MGFLPKLVASIDWDINSYHAFLQFDALVVYLQLHTDVRFFQVDFFAGNIFKIRNIKHSIRGKGSVDLETWANESAFAWQSVESWGPTIASLKVGKQWTKCFGKIP